MNQVKTEHGETRWMVETTVDNSKLVLFAGVDESNAEDLLRDVLKQLPSKWPELYQAMRSSFEDYGHSADFPPGEFFARICRMTPGAYLADRSNLLLRFEFEVEPYSDSIPIYDFFLKDDLEVVDHQPVF